MIIKKTSDKISLKVGELVVKISPLTQLQKTEVNQLLMSGNLDQTMKGTALAIAYALKDIDGINNEDGTKYVLEKDDQGKLNDNIVDDLLNAPFAGEITLVAFNLLNGVPEEFIDPETGEKLKNVDIIKSEGKKPAKK